MTESKKKGGVASLVTASIAVAAIVPQVSMARGAATATSIQATLERRLQMMEAEMKALRAELEASRAKAEAEAAEAKSVARSTAQRVEAQQAEVKQQLEHVKVHHDLLFFRGGYTDMEHARNGELLLNNPALNPAYNKKNDGEGWYVGAGFDHRLSDDVWGMMDDVAVDGEVMFEYLNYGTSRNALVAAASGGLQIENQLTMFTLTASPKIKYTGLGDFMPWVIPFGLGIHVVSPPSSGVTVLNPGLQLGVGGEYRIWESLYAGLDFRYHFTGGDLDYKTILPNGTTILNQTNTDYLTAGAYLGFGF